MLLSIYAEQSKEEFTVCVTTAFSFQPAGKLHVNNHFWDIEGENRTQNELISKNLL
jgi:hypothetical protein